MKLNTIISAEVAAAAYRHGWNDRTAGLTLSHVRQAQREAKLTERYPRAACLIR
jgi:hypothetical protein